MTALDLTDEVLMAFADDELSPEEASIVAARLKTDPDAQQRVEMFRETRRRAAQTASEHQVPDALRARVEAMIADQSPPEQKQTATVTRLTQPARPSSSRPWAMALAASLALAVGLGSGLLIQRNTQAPAPQTAFLSGVELAPLLESLPSGDSGATSSNPVTIIASFRDGTGRLCREVQVQHSEEDSVLGVLCRDGQAWTPELAFRTASGPGFMPASGLETLDSFLLSIDAGPVLTPQEEQAALAEPPAP